MKSPTFGVFFIIGWGESGKAI